MFGDKSSEKCSLLRDLDRPNYITFSTLHYVGHSVMKVYRIAWEAFGKDIPRSALASLEIQCVMFTDVAGNDAEYLRRLRQH
jgi:hypothetical protein